MNGLAPENLALSGSESPDGYTHILQPFKYGFKSPCSHSRYSWAAQFRSLWSCKLQKGTWIFWLLMPTSFQSSLLWSGGRCHLWKIIHLQCHVVWDCDVRLWQGFRITPEEGNEQVTSDSHSWSKFRGKGFFLRSNQCLEDWGFDLSCGQTVPWAQGGHQARCPAGTELPPLPTHTFMLMAFSGHRTCA